jgi:hypothetical protein
MTPLSSHTNWKTPKTLFIQSIVVLIALFFFSNLGIAYEELTTFTGGHLRGTVTLKGKPVKPRRFNLSLYPDPYYCGRISDGKGWRYTPFMTSSANQTVSGIIVYIQNINRGKHFSVPMATVSAKNCRFSPYLSLLKQEDLVMFENWDPVQHKLEIYQFSESGARFIRRENLPRPLKSKKSDFLITGKHVQHRRGLVVLHEVTSPGPLVFRCAYHEYMEGWGFIMTHPYFTLTDDEGHYSLENIPPGTYQVVAWHPSGKIEHTIHVNPEQNHVLHMEFEAEGPIVPPLSQPKQNPFGIELTGDPHIVPTVELQEWKD